MKVRTLDHVNIRTRLVGETLDFYTGVLGMTCKPLPGAQDSSRGGWIYSDDDRPVIHVGSFEGRYPGDGEAPASEGQTSGSGAIHHVALECLGYDEMYARLTDARLEVATNDFPQMQLRQLFVKDPNGIVLELNFRGAAAD